MKDTDARWTEERIRELLEQAGPRPEVPSEDLAEIQAAFRATWREHVERTSRPEAEASQASGPSPWSLGLAAAAVLLVGLGLWWWSVVEPAARVSAARVERLEGVVTVHREGSAARLTTHDVIPPGGELATGTTGRLALQLANGTSLRLDSATRARLASVESVDLEQGAVYVDTGPADATESIRIATPFGTATDVGTRFEVRLVEGHSGAVRVRVREGLVEVTDENVSATAGAGVELTLHGDGAVTRGRVAPYGSDWAWVVDLAPPFELEGRTLSEFLRWVTRETGWTLRYGNPGLEASAESIVLHGSMGGLAPDQALEVVLPGAGLEHEVVDGVLVVKTSSESPPKAESRASSPPP